ncbi:MAG: carbohydrate ABC transporter substrate-binding protein [Lachnospiraceae bacterium]|nr:carbohydrate ABC transporter substrate-binding protein [Lachnospiraceae bacterium]
MKKRMRRWLGILLAISLCASYMAGCSETVTDDSPTASSESDGYVTESKETEDQTAEQTADQTVEDTPASDTEVEEIPYTEYIYEQVPMGIELPMDRVSDIVTDGEILYVSGYTWDWSGEDGILNQMLISCRMDGSEMKTLLTGNRCSADGLYWKGDGFEVNEMEIDPEGNLIALVWESVQDDETPTRTPYLIKMSAAGEELWRVKVGGGNDMRRLFCANDVILLSLYTWSENMLSLLDVELAAYESDGELLYQISTKDVTEISEIVEDREGDIYLLESGVKSDTLTLIDPLTGELGVPAEAAITDYDDWYGSAPRLLDSNGKDTMFLSGHHISRYDMETGSFTEVMNLLGSGIDDQDISAIFALDDWTFMAAMRSGESYEEEKDTLTKLVKMDPEEADKSRTIVMGVDYIADWLMLDQLVAFNQENTEYRFKLVEYHGDYEKLKADIRSGNGPDLLTIYDESAIYDELKQGYFEDLYPWIDSDPEMDREDFVTGVLEAASLDGKLYTIPHSFCVYTVAGKTSVVGNESGWSIREAQQCWAGYPDSEELITWSYAGMSHRNGRLFEEILRTGGELFVNEAEGTCDFLNDEFIALLEIEDRIREKTVFSEGDNKPERYRSDEVLLQEVRVAEFDRLTDLEEIFGEEVTLIGYPGVKGNGAIISEDVNAGVPEFFMAADSEAKDGVWQYIRGYLSEEYQREVQSFPIRLSALQERAENAAAWREYPDENGNSVMRQRVTEAQAQKILELIMGAESGRFYEQKSWLDEVTEIVKQKAEKFINGQISAQEAAELIQEEVEALMIK